MAFRRIRVEWLVMFADCGSIGGTRRASVIGFITGSDSKGTSTIDFIYAIGLVCAKCGTVETSKGGATTDAAIVE